MASQPWQAEVSVDMERARALLGTAAPELAGASITRLGEGWDNTVFLVDGRMTLRFPRRAMALPAAEAEWAALSALAGRLPVEVPVPRLRGQPALGFPWPFAGYSMVQGQTACRAALGPSARARLAGPLGALLAALHRVPPADAPGLGEDPLEKANLARRWPVIEGWLAEARALGLLHEALADRARRGMAEAAATPWQGRARALTHGDLYIRHLIVDADHMLTGVIDWGDSCWGDPAVDVAVAFSCLPPDARGAFWAAYGEIDGTTELLARGRALFSSLAILIYGHHQDQPDLAREGRFGLNWAST